MRSAGKKQTIILRGVMGLAVLLQALLVFYLQRRFAFLLEDMDYMKNLKTGGELKGIGDIIAGIPAILGEKGGSVLSIAILQGILLAGEMFADVLNTLVLLFISLLIGRAAKASMKHIMFFALPFFMLISLNSDWQYSYMWEFGIVNFVFPAIPFLIFLITVIKELNRGREQLPGWQTGIAVISAFFAGWANASYGLVSMCIALTATFIVTRMLKRRAPIWLPVAMIAGVIGTFLYLAASGNFKDGAVINGVYISYSIFPGVVLALLLIAVILRSGGFLTIDQMLLIVALGFGILLRFVVGWIPGIAANGIQICVMIISIVLFCSLLVTIRKEYPRQRLWCVLTTVCAFVYALFNMLETFGGVS